MAHEDGLTVIGTDIRIVLVAPEIPQNAGNIARLCAATGAVLHLIRPLGFFIDDRHLRRAGLDYWNMVQFHTHDSFDDFTSAFPGVPLVMASTRGCMAHTDVHYTSNSALVFGPETRGLPNDILSRPDGCVVRIPMLYGARSLNLANSVSIVLYEALRQLGFPGLTVDPYRV